MYIYGIIFLEGEVNNLDSNEITRISSKYLTLDCLNVLKLAMATESKDHQLYLVTPFGIIRGVI